MGATTSTFAKLSPVTLPSLEFGAPQRGFGLHRKVNRENLTVPSLGCMGGRLPGPKATTTLPFIDKHQITLFCVKVATAIFISAAQRYRSLVFLLCEE